MNQAWKLALRDLRGSKAGLRLLAICLFLGVATLAGIGSLSSAILGNLAERGQLILGGDFEMETAQRLATPKERAAFDTAGTVSETVRMRAMAAREDASASILAELKGVDAAYPLYGELKLGPGALASRPTGTDVAVARALGEKLGLKIGDRVRIGEASLRIIGFIAEEPDRVGEGFTLGPVALVDLKGLEATALVQPGSLFNTKYRVRTKAGVDPAKAADALAAQFPEAGWETQDRSNGAPGTRRFIQNLGQFLSLVGLASLVVAGIGVGNGVGSWLEGKRGSIATLKVLGASSATIFRTYLIQIIVVAALATILGLAVGALAPWVIAQLAGDALPVAPRLDVYPVPLMVASVYGLLIALLFSLAPLARARAVAPASLFRTGVEGSERPSTQIIIALAVIAGIIAALAIGTAREPKFAAIFVACVVALLALLAGLGTGIQTLAARLPRPKAPLIRLALANLHRPGAQTGRLVVALGLGLTLFATLAFVQTSLNNQIASTIPKRAPSFFALDIPKEDEARFRAAITARSPKADLNMVPTLRGPVVAVNGQRVSEMKNLPREAWFLRGDRGLTFSKNIPEGSRLTGGTWWAADYAGPPLVSLDEVAGKALDLKIGDTLVVSVLGVEMEATISSFREVDWETMGFNFVMVFSPGSLDAAPFTFASTIATDAADEAAIARTVAQGYPSVSMIRVKDLITQISDLLGQLATAITIAASVAVLAGIAVLTGAIAASRRSRSYDAVLLKLLGATRAQVLGVQAMEYAALAAILSLIALAIGAAAGWVTMTQVFTLEWTPDWGIVAATVAAGALGTLALGLIGALPALAARPSEALRAL